jgi:NAD(P)-dependent dehydrogenase (short-subunit alcohol dehydrogenase family)
VFDLAGRAILVTGGSRGIGRAVVRELADAGARVAVHGRAPSEALRSSADEARERGAEAFEVTGDMLRPEEAKTVVRDAVRAMGGLDGLVLSAGIYRDEPLLGTSASRFDEVLHTDLLGPLETLRGAAGALGASGRGAAVTVSSILGHAAAPYGAAYQAAKAGVEHLTRAAAVELAPRVRVNCVAPGFIRTDMNRGGHEDADFSAFVRRGTPLARWGDPEDVAPAVRYLLSDESSWVTGVVLGVDGGLGLE